jgi:hypothetical protein
MGLCELIGSHIATGRFWMRPHVRVILVGLLVLVIVVAAIVWTTRSNAPVPEYQNRVAIPGSSPHPVSLWLDPSPASTGMVELTAQIGDPSGMPIGVSNVEFYVFPDGMFPNQSIPGSYTEDAPIQDFLGRGHGYTALVDFPEPGTWQVEVRFELGGGERATIFEIPVVD